MEEIVISGTKDWYKSAVVKRRRGYEAESEEFEVLTR